MKNEENNFTGGGVGLILNTLLCPTQALADNCTDGTEFMGKNGHTYCVSNVSLNWWSAFNWCTSQGRHLASIDEVCTVSDTEYWVGGSGSKACPNIIDGGLNRWGWTSLGIGTSYAYAVHLFSGEVSHNHVSRNDGALVALCW